MKLTKAAQIKILTQVKNNYKEYIENKKSIKFLCIESRDVIRKTLNIGIVDSDNVYQYIPLFNRVNADVICEKYNFPTTNGFRAWWHIDQYNKTQEQVNIEMNQLRYDFIKALIKEIKLPNKKRG